MQLEVDRGDYRRTRLVEAPPPDAPGDGQVVLAVERFALTANNVTYAVAGDVMDYWGFFPAEAPWGRIPVMGFGRVESSTLDGVAAGERYFGFFPMAERHVVDATPSRTGFVDAGAHRSGHAPTYRRFERLAGGGDETTEDRRLLLRGLFTTSFLIDDFLAEHDGFGAETVLVTSASSKTSIGLAHALRQRGTERSVGLTSARNAAFVEGLGLYDEVRTYDELEAVDATTPAVVVDMAGDADVLGRIHRHHGEALRHSCQVGVTHWEEAGDTSGLPGPKPTMFFAPSQIVKRSEEWGREAFAARVDDGLDAFVADAARWLTVDRSAGPEEVQRAYLETVDGRIPPDHGQILSMDPQAFPAA